MISLQGSVIHALVPGKNTNMEVSAAGLGPLSWGSDQVSDTGRDLQLTGPRNKGRQAGVVFKARMYKFHHGMKRYSGK